MTVGLLPAPSGGHPMQMPMGVQMQMQVPQQMQMSPEGAGGPASMPAAGSSEEQWQQQQQQQHLQHQQQQQQYHHHQQQMYGMYGAPRPNMYYQQPGGPTPVSVQPGLRFMIGPTFCTLNGPSLWICRAWVVLPPSITSRLLMVMSTSPYVVGGEVGVVAAPGVGSSSRWTCTGGAVATGAEPNWLVLARKAVDGDPGSLQAGANFMRVQIPTHS
jgi:hypothetical protein